VTEARRRLLVAASSYWLWLLLLRGVSLTSVGRPPAPRRGGSRSVRARHSLSVQCSRQLRSVGPKFAAAAAQADTAALPPLSPLLVAGVMVPPLAGG